MQFLENIDIKSQEDVVAHLGAQAARRHTSIEGTANVMPTSKTFVRSFRVSHGVRPLTCCWQLTNRRVSLGRPRLPHKVRVGASPLPKWVNYSLLKKDVGVSGGQAATMEM